MAEQRYKVIERIDAGGMAEVFKANSTSMQGFEKLVAIKRILPNLTQNERFVRMFLDEAKVSLHLNHTNCVHVFDLGIADGTYFIVMEFVDGTNLKKLIEFLHKHSQPMRVETAVFIAIEVCKGLTHAHEKLDQKGNPLDIVHRDISPPNILLSKAGEVKITDFGLAKAKSQAESTDPGVVKGKFGYLSPEAAHGEDIDERTDIFALGILLWEMLAGRRLFLGKSDHDTLQLVRKAEIPPITQVRDDVPLELQRVMLQSLARETGDRFQSARDMGRALANFLFDYGEVVTSYDLAELVTQFHEQRPQRKKTAADQAVGAVVQQQLDQLKSLEEIKDLDMYLASHYDSLPDQGEVATDGDGNFEDPRMWADLGFGGGEAPEGANPLLEGGAGSAGGGGGGGDGSDAGSGAGSGDSDSWQEAGLDDLAKSTSSYDAIDVSDGRQAAQAAKAAGQGTDQAGPPTLPGAMKAPSKDKSPSSKNQNSQDSPKSKRRSRPGEILADEMPAQQKQDQPGSTTTNRKAPDVTPRKERTDTPVVSRDDNKSKDSSGGLGAIPLTILVALIVVLLGAGAGFALGLLPPT